MTTATASVRAIAEWVDEYGNTHCWPMATADNRRSRVLARIARFQIPIIPESLLITNL